MRIVAALLPATCLFCCQHELDLHEPGADLDGASVVYDGDPADLYDADGLGAASPAPVPFVRLGVRFTANDPSALTLRTSVDGAHWSDWQTPTLVFSEENAHAGHIDVAGDAALYFQPRIEPGKEAPLFMDLEPIAEVGDPTAQPIVVEQSAQEQGLNVDIQSRASWGARAPNCRSTTTVQRATVHHTVGSNDDDLNVKVQLRQIQAFHMFTRGWCDIGYNFLVSRDGRIWEGRGYGVLGAHTENANSGNMGISFMGTYTSATPPLAQQIGGAKALRYLHDRAGIPLTRDGFDGVKGHRQRGTTSTTCPGDALYAKLGSIVERARTGDFAQGPCASGDFHGQFCDDEGSANEDDHNRLKNVLGVDFHCADKQGSPAYCPNTDATRKDAVFVLLAAADVPLGGHGDAFPDDDGKREAYFNAAHDYGIVLGIDGRAEPDRKLSRSSAAVILKRMYALPPADRDYFDDDDDSANEDAHNRAAAAGLFSGFADAGGRRDFKGSQIATRSTLAVLAWRAHHANLVPVWRIPDACLSGNFAGAFCDDEGAGAEAGANLLFDSDVHLAWGSLAGQRTFDGATPATRAAVIYAMTQVEGIPLDGNPDGFDDDDGHPREAWFDAAKVWGVITGYAGGTEVRATEAANRDTIAIVAARMYALPDPGVDYFTDDDGTNMEPWHDKVAAAGLFLGVDDGNGGRKFNGAGAATRTTIAVVMQRARNAGLVPIWR